jgi:primosomal protein N' (replication factor Y)
MEQGRLIFAFYNLGFIILMRNTNKLLNKSIRTAVSCKGRCYCFGAIASSKSTLGSATPSIETYFNAKSDKFGLIEITERFGNVLMPTIELVDLKDKYFQK